MNITTSIAVQAFLTGLSLLVIILRCWVRLRVEHRALTAADYLIWCGWVCAVGWFICSIKALTILIDHPLLEPDIVSDNVEYLKTVFISCFCFDIGLYFPKASIMAFYWWLITPGFKRLRIALYIGTGYLSCAFLATLFYDFFHTRPISDNWSLENQLDSVWNSYNGFIVNWSLNISTDILLFCLPFALLNCLKLRLRQKIGLVIVFSLGLITICISLARFTAYIVSDWTIPDTDGNAWCTAEMCTAIIVVSLPGLKRLVSRDTTPPNSQYNRNTHGYVQTGSGKPKETPKNTTTGSSSSYINGGKWDDEMELVYLDREQMGQKAKDVSNVVTVTRDGTVSKDVM